MKKYYFLSSFLHLVLLILIVLSNGNSDGSGKGEGTGPNEKNEESSNKSGSNDHKNIIPKAVEVTIVTQPKKGSSTKQQPKKSVGVKDCKDNGWYGGIGIEHDYTSGTVTNVAEGYPAFKAGIVAGDQFVNLDRTKIIGEPGTHVIFVMRRLDNSYKMYNLVREKICIK